SEEPQSQFTKTLLIVEVSCASSLLGFFVILGQKVLTIGSPAYRAGSTFLNANYYGAITVLVVLLSIYKMIQPEQKHWQRYLLIAAMNMGGLCLSDCRSAMAALAVAVIVMLALNKRFHMLGILLGIEALAVVAVCLSPAIMPRIHDAGVDLVYRLSIWQTAVKGFLEHPFFGQGGGAYRLIFAKFGGPDEMHAHSLFLDPLLNFGIIGTAIFAIYFKSSLRSIRNMLDHPQDLQRFFLMAAVLVCVVIHGVTDITVFSVQTGLLVSVLMGVAGIRKNQPETAARAYAGVIWRDMGGGRGIRLPEVSVMSKGRSFLSHQPPK
ncbi:MAG TPA: O-antigen ligase family protein, partial [Clostridia bacterium]